MQTCSSGFSDKPRGGKRASLIIGRQKGAYDHRDWLIHTEAGQHDGGGSTILKNSAGTNRGTPEKRPILKRATILNNSSG